MTRTPIYAIGIVLLTGSLAWAEPQARGAVGPADDDLTFYLACSEIATRRPLSFDEAAVCGQVFQRIKLSFVPGVRPADFEQLSPADRAAVNLDGYRRFLDWSAQHAGEIDALRDNVGAASVLAAD